MKHKILGIIYIIINLNNIFTVSKLFQKEKYNEIIDICKRWLNKKEDDILAKRSIAIAYAYIGKTDEGFDFIKEMIQKTKSNKGIEEIMQYFIYPEFKKKNYDKIIYRCSYFTNERMSQEVKDKINKIISEAHRLERESFKTISVQG